MRNLLKLAAAMLLVSGLALSQASTPPLGSDAVPVKVTSSSGVTCNAVVYSQIPGQADLFLGRAKSCSDPSLADPWLALYRMNWSTHTLNYVQAVLPVPAKISGKVTLKKAYDPSVIEYNGQLWVSFECTSPDLPGVSACMGQLSSSTWTIAPSSVYVVVEGEVTQGYMWSASVPNLFVFQNRVYIYWSAIQSLSGTWYGITVRGMELTQTGSGQLWGVGSHNAAVPSYAPSLNEEVVGVNPSDPYSDQTADLKGLYTDGTYIYVMISLGGKGPNGDQDCTSAGGTSYGCFRLQIFRSSVAVGLDVFNQTPLKSPQLPFNPVGYQRFCIDGNTGKLSIIGVFYMPNYSYSDPSLFFLPPGLQEYSIDLSGLGF